MASLVVLGQTVSLLYIAAGLVLLLLRLLLSPPCCYCCCRLMQVRELYPCSRMLLQCP